MKKVSVVFCGFFIFLSGISINICGMVAKQEWYSLSIDGVCLEFPNVDSCNLFKKAYQDAENFGPEDYIQQLVAKIKEHGALDEASRRGGYEIGGIMYSARQCYCLAPMQLADVITGEILGSSKVFESPLIVAAQSKDYPILIHLLNIANEMLPDEQFKRVIDKLTSWITAGAFDDNKHYVFFAVRRSAWDLARKMQFLLNKDNAFLISAGLSGKTKYVKRLIKNCFKLAAGCDRTQDYLRAIAKKYLLSDQFLDDVKQKDYYNVEVFIE